MSGMAALCTILTSITSWFIGSRSRAPVECTELVFILEEGMERDGRWEGGGRESKRRGTYRRKRKGGRHGEGEEARDMNSILAIVQCDFLPLPSLPLHSLLLHQTHSPTHTLVHQNIALSLLYLKVQLTSQQLTSMAEGEMTNSQNRKLHYESDQSTD